MDSRTKNRQCMERIEQMVLSALHSINPCFKEQPLCIQELTNGYYNAAYDITHGCDSYILKIAPPPYVAVMSYEKDLMDTEVYAMQLLKEHSKLPVPTVLYYDTTKSLCNSNYLLMEKMPGQNLDYLEKVSLSKSETDQLHKELGILNAKINDVTSDYYGLPGRQETYRDNQKDFFLLLVDMVLTDGLRIDLDIGIPYDKVHRLILDACSALKEVNRPALVHFDLWDGNVLVHQNKITGIIDFERAMFTDPMMEYYFRYHSHNHSFLCGYQIGAKSLLNYRNLYPIRANLYDIYLYLVMSIETKYRMYPTKDQYTFATTQLKEAYTRLKQLL